MINRYFKYPDPIQNLSNIIQLKEYILLIISYLGILMYWLFSLVLRIFRYFLHLFYTLKSEIILYLYAI